MARLCVLGKGYATEAARAVIDYAFDDLHYDVLHAGARVSNPASRRVLEKCGFQVSVDGSRPLPHPFPRLVRAYRPFPARPRAVGLAKKLERGEQIVTALPSPQQRCHVRSAHMKSGVPARRWDAVFNNWNLMTHDLNVGCRAPIDSRLQHHQDCCVYESLSG